MTGVHTVQAVTGFRADGLQQGYRRRTVLRGLDLTATEGVLGLLGPNGAGKTTLLRTIATALTPRGGHLKILGIDASDDRRRRELRRRLGFLPQSFGYFPHFTVLEFVEYVAWLKEMPSAGLTDAATRAVEAVGLESELHTRLSSLSGGRPRRAGIAQANVNCPDLLILDEPTAGLDPEQRVAFRALVRDIGSRGLVVLATHLVEDVAAVCDDVVVMSDGQIMFRGAPHQLAERGQHAGLGDTALERGYVAVLESARKGQG